MPANTPLGYPYPLGTDRLADGDDAIHNLATAVEQKAGVWASGTSDINISTANTANTKAITFPSGRFTAPPVVVGNAQTGNPATRFGSATNADKNGFTLVANSTATGTVTVGWVAVQQG